MIQYFLICFSPIVAVNIENPLDTKPPADEPVAVSYTASDIALAYESFNKYLLHPKRNIYMRDTEAKTAVGAIWTQAIYWDMTMNAYKRTGSDSDKPVSSTDAVSCYDASGIPALMLLCPTVPIL